MFLTKYRPRSAFDSIFDGDLFPVLRGYFDNDEKEDFVRLPKTNVNQTDTDYVLTMEMPGVDKKNVNVTIENDQLIISGEQTYKTEDKGLIRREIRSEKFRRSFSLGHSVDRENLKAKMDNGILTVVLPKVKESVGRKINID